MPKTQNLLTLVPSILLLSFLFVAAMADSQPQSTSDAKVYIVYTHKPDEGVEHEDFHLKTLASVVGSEDAAKEAILYTYKHAASGFSAKLTPAQVDELSKKPGVLQVVRSQTVQLHSSHTGLA
ncbi:PREDICTED: subtilisin-like protease SBT3.12 [Ipomoea nil]|uniref:subtilisin-like protease SBT3.12 n=1 Tax=Ipomoea nil TaxID=35883 RepID=UPI000900893D|nr:PREDICTED: subtilisin-like protease SBT3.12 [Ipomoea nil]